MASSSVIASSVCHCDARRCAVGRRASTPLLSLHPHNIHSSKSICVTGCAGPFHCTWPYYSAAACNCYWAKKIVREMWTKIGSIQTANLPYWIHSAARL